MQAYERLERDLAKWAGFDHEQVVACSSGTAALHLAAEVLGLDPTVHSLASDVLYGSRCLVPDYTMIACPRAVTMAGLVPTFVECKPDLTIDVDKVAQCLERYDVNPNDRIERRVRAIMPVHVYGRSCDMPAIADLAGKYDLRVIEDLAEAHGLPPHPNTDAACWSFYRNKIVAGEEGGAVAFKDRAHAHRARMLRSLGFTDAHDYTHVPRGHNYRLANCLASLVGESLARVKDNTIKRWTAYQLWESACPTAWKMSIPDQPWVYSFRIPGLLPETQGAIVRALKKRGIEARHGFKPCRRQEEYRSLPTLGEPYEWESDRAAREVIYLPVDRSVTSAEAQDVFDLIALMVG